MFGKYAILRLFSSSSSLELITMPVIEARIATVIPIESTNLIVIKQRYIWRLNNHRILAQASHEKYQKLGEKISPTQKINSKILRKRCFMTQKGILAFSGGLDTSVVVKYLQEEHDMDVITVTVDVGQGDDTKKIAAKAKKLGVKKHYNIDARKEFVLSLIHI